MDYHGEIPISKVAMAGILGAWEKITNRLKDRLGKSVFETWILPLRPRSKDGSSLILEAPDNFFREWVEKHYKQIIREAIV